LKGNTYFQTCRGCDYTKKTRNGICSVANASDHLSVRCVGDWAKDKYFYIGRYIDLFSTAMKDKWHGNLYYIDLFAGCGKCRVRDSGEELDGSAILALKVKYPFKKYFFVELDSDALNSLKQRIKRFGIKGKVDLIEGDCNEKVEEIIQKIPAKGTLCLAIIDPTGLQIRFDTIKKLADHHKVDLLITFPEGMAIKRNLEKFLKQPDSVLDDFMGGKEWRSMFTKSKLGEIKLQEREKRFIQLYREKLDSIGYVETISGEEVLIRSSEKRLPLYFLLFASKHSLGHKFWSKIGQIEASGQQKLKLNNPSSLLTNKLKIKIRRPKIHHKEYLLLNGRKQLLVEKVNDGSIIKRFDKTPYPKKPTDVICPHFLELKWAYGCPFDCAWCYLKGTFRFRPEGTKPAFKPLEKIRNHVETFLGEVKIPEVLNTGEIADSLMGEQGDCPFSKFIISFFEGQNRHKVLL